MGRMWMRIKRHPVVFLMGYFALYNVVFWFLEAWVRPVHMVHCRLDDMMPFCSAAVIPYMMWFGWVPAILLLFYLHSAESYWQLFGALANGITIALVSYVVYPTGLSLRRPVSGQSLCDRLVGFIYRTDTATNVCPSLHVFVTVLLLLAILSAPWITSALFRWSSTLLSLSICASTVLIDQHSLIDVFFGAALALFTYALSYRAAFALHRAPAAQTANAAQ
jgi:membrane-associated phospholipid phosphatase